MSKADEMFENLGYAKEDIRKRTANGLIRYSHPLNIIQFNKDSNIRALNGLYPDEIKAIYEKCKELGWLSGE